MPSRFHRRAALFLVPLTLATTSTHAASIWVEGEAPTRKNVTAHSWYNSVKKDVLSGGDWLSNYGSPGDVGYDVQVTEPAGYVLWARLNPVASQPQWRIDGGDWKPVQFGDSRGQQNIASDNRFDHRFIAWVKLVQLQLTAGKHTLDFRWEGGAQNSGALDCFVLTSDGFVPQGTMKPGDQAASGGEGEAGPADAIWIEGENATHQGMTRHPWWYDKVKQDVLSGGDWISNYNKEKEGTAEYEFDVLTADTYALWVRANPSVDAKLEWKLDGATADAKWTPIDFKDARGMQNIAADNKPDMRFIAWVKAGNVKLTPGKHTIAFKMNSGIQRENHGGLDCFVFTRVPFVPAGAKKPTVASSKSGPGDWFPLLADEDTFDPRSVIDMSRLVPAPAGQFGFLKADGKSLRFEKGTAPVKFWGCGANAEPGRYSREQLATRIKYLRKFGVNVVRQHAVFDELETNGKIDPKKLDEYDWWFAELKKAGIYSDWSVFYHFTIGPNDGYDPALYGELEGKPDRKDTYGIITMSPELWSIRNKTVTSLLQHKNPYTGLRYVDDPALVFVEMQNEDSIFFWNPLGWLAEGKKMPKHSKLLRERFAAWVKAKYKTDEALKAAWGELREGDSVRATELRIMSPWELEGKGPRGSFAGLNKRAGDFIEFLTEMQVALFKSGEKTMRDAGFKGVSMTTAWQVGGAATDPANIFTDSGRRDDRPAQLRRRWRGRPRHHRG
jgi:hypothetical protein